MTLNTIQVAFLLVVVLCVFPAAVVCGRPKPGTAFISTTSQVMTYATPEVSGVYTFELMPGGSLSLEPIHISCIRESSAVGFQWPLSHPSDIGSLHSQALASLGRGTPAAPDENNKPAASSAPQTTGCSSVEVFLRFSKQTEGAFTVKLKRDKGSAAGLWGEPAAVNRNPNEHLAKDPAHQQSSGAGGSVSTLFAGEILKRCHDSDDECYNTQHLTYTTSFKDYTPAAHANHYGPFCNSSDGVVGGACRHTDYAPTVPFDARISAQLFDVDTNGWSLVFGHKLTSATVSRLAPIYLQLEVRLRAESKTSYIWVAIAYTVAIFTFFAALLLGVKRARPGRYRARRTHTRTVVDEDGNEVQIVEEDTETDNDDDFEADEDFLGMGTRPPREVPDLPKVKGQTISPRWLEMKKRMDEAEEGQKKPQAEMATAEGASAPTEAEPAPSPSKENAVGAAQSSQKEDAVAKVTEEHVPLPPPTSSRAGAAEAVVALEREAIEAPNERTVLLKKEETDDDGPKPTVANDDEEELPICRICQMDDPLEDLFAPCACRGSSKYVHRECLEKWRTTTTNPEHQAKCAECKTDFEVQTVDDENGNAASKKKTQRSGLPALAMALGGVLAIVFVNIWLAIKPLVVIFTVVLGGGYAVKITNMLFTFDLRGIIWTPWHFYHWVLGLSFLLSMTLCHVHLHYFVLGISRPHQRFIKTLMAIFSPVMLGRSVQYLLWSLNSFVLTPEVWYCSGMILLFVLVVHVVPSIVRSLENHRQQQEMEQWRNTVLRMRAEREEADAALPPARRRAPQQRRGNDAAAGANGGDEDDEAPPRIVVDTLRTRQEEEMRRRMLLRNRYEQLQAHAAQTGNPHDALRASVFRRILELRHLQNDLGMRPLQQRNRRAFFTEEETEADAGGVEEMTETETPDEETPRNGTPSSSEDDE